MAYIYNADIWCDSCGRDIKKHLKKEGKAPPNPRDEYSYDSDEYPKHVCDDDESDCPQHCGAGEDCLEAEVLDSGEKVGALIGDNLTTEGIEYVRDSHRTDPNEVTQLWVNHFGIEMDDEETDDWDD